MLCPSNLCMFSLAFCVSHVSRPNGLATYWATCEACSEKESKELEYDHSINALLFHLIIFKMY
jgi:hypothetical protein